jgi:hypothetical protein
LLLVLDPMSVIGRIVSLFSRGEIRVQAQGLGNRSGYGMDGARVAYNPISYQGARVSVERLTVKKERMKATGLRDWHRHNHAKIGEYGTSGLGKGLSILGSASRIAEKLPSIGFLLSLPANIYEFKAGHDEVRMGRIERTLGDHAEARYHRWQGFSGMATGSLNGIADGARFMGGVLAKPLGLVASGAGILSGAGFLIATVAEVIGNIRTCRSIWHNSKALSRIKRLEIEHARAENRKRQDFLKRENNGLRLQFAGRCFLIGVNTAIGIALIAGVSVTTIGTAVAIPAFIGLGLYISGALQRRKAKLDFAKSGPCVIVPVVRVSYNRFNRPGVICVAGRRVSAKEIVADIYPQASRKTGSFRGFLSKKVTEYEKRLASGDIDARQSLHVKGCYIRDVFLLSQINRTYWTQNQREENKKRAGISSDITRIKKAIGFYLELKMVLRTPDDHFNFPLDSKYDSFKDQLEAELKHLLRLETCLV